MRQPRLNHRAGVAAIIAAVLGAGVVTAVLAGSGGSTSSGSTVAVVRTIVTTATGVTSAPATETAPSLMPEVVDQPLDQARAAVVAAGGSVELRGGGLFGVIDESAWTVCSSKPKSGTGLDPGEIVVLHVDRTCD